ncbi:ribonuclease P/MRP protein subunit POP5-like [Bombus terrestris]|uniref:Ribonuclease P/MRP protein subunit POP5 n=1 Tax=Bombus terrestris TaxID=30195 RepID=A0A9C6SAC4_BOMTE|nr:ribonuclease P/MRP protein subunit POP5-like [Bombus terrestris]XP_048262128.1 ribonuclease P/MRP protein subunit POP5-like [Bombus terrestris]XP_048262129.1 ribonuclease P/MRP protein subunit POP5-like [Bombus terrestris]XP_048262130.1 ribonuclease P/MRP protein subunit POP5-like [Bombus terrestris]XP_048262131.1 ribonuclease P/MRP protein subunit POP5-like [Bombus terrestris]XP_048262132.1 ribonuclease P/MRP protein subunit POP5-like [Bombus terrestris]XP_048262133.1 ribonuclease P/MRP p
MVRFKNRYIIFEITVGDKSNKPLQLKTMILHNAIQQKVQQLYGDFGVAAIKAGFSAKYCNIHTKIALVKTRHGPHKFLLKAIPIINDIAGRLVSVKILYVGATLKHCFLFIKRYQQQKLEKVWGTLKTETERKNMENALMTLTPAMKDCT